MQSKKGSICHVFINIDPQIPNCVNKQLQVNTNFLHLYVREM